MNAGAKQRLARIDVADADDDAAVHQVLLDGDAAIAARAPEVVGVELVAERLRPQVLQQRMRARCRRQQEAAEAAWVVEPKSPAAVEVHVDMIVWRRLEGLGQVTKAARHAEVHKQRAGVGPEQEIFGAPLESADA